MMNISDDHDDDNCGFIVVFFNLYYDRLYCCSLTQSHSHSHVQHGPTALPNGHTDLSPDLGQL